MFNNKIHYLYNNINIFKIICKVFVRAIIYYTFLYIIYLYKELRVIYLTNNIKLFSAIDIGSHELRMKIVQKKKNDEISTIDEISNIMPLGRDTFTKNKLSFDSVYQLCGILEGYKALMNDYGVKACKLVATSAIREAENKNYIIDQIKIKTGFKVDIINNYQEKYYSYKAIKHLIKKNSNNINSNRSLILDIGSGTIQISTLKDKKLTYSRNMKLGSLRINEILSSLQNRTLNYTKVLEEYIDAHIEDYNFMYSNKDDALNFVVLGGVIDIIASICKSPIKEGNFTYIKKSNFERLYDNLINKSAELIASEYNINFEKADLIVPTLILIKRFFDRSNSDYMLVPNISLIDGIIYYNLILKKEIEKDLIADEDIISYTRELSKKFNFDKKHTDYVEKACLYIFDNLKKIHGLTKERSYLQIAAILHDIGKFLASEPHYEHSYHLINSCGIIGMSDIELIIISNIARYHSIEVPGPSNLSFINLRPKNKVLIAKLASIIRIADSLDTSHKQKIRLTNIEINKNNIIIEGESTEEVLLEQWTFEKKSEFFREVFGIKPVLKVKVKIF